MSQPKEVVHWRSAKIYSASLRLDNSQKVLVKYGELEYKACKNVLVEQSKVMGDPLVLQDPTGGELIINEAFVSFPKAVTLFLDFMHFEEAVDIGLSSTEDALRAYKIMIFYKCQESLMNLFYNALMKRLSSSWKRESPEWARTAREICGTKTFRSGNPKLWKLFRALILRSTAMQLAAIIMEDFGKGEMLCSYPLKMDCISKPGKFSYDHTDGEVDFRFLIDVSQPGVKIDVCVIGSPLGAVYSFHLLPPIGRGDRRYDARGEVRSTGQWSMAHSPIPVAFNSKFHLVIGYTKEWSILNLVRSWLQANGHLVEGCWSAHAADPTALDVDLITILVSFHALVGSQPEGRHACLHIAGCLGRCLDPYNPNDIKPSSLQQLEKDCMAEFLNSLYAENNPKLGFQSAVLMKLLEDWANFDWDTRKCEFIDIIQSLEFLKEVPTQATQKTTEEEERNYFLLLDNELESWSKEISVPELTTTKISLYPHPAA